MSKSVNTVENNKTNRWTPSEDAALMKAVNSKSKSATMTEVFAQFGSAHNRAAGSVAQHYYTLARKESSVAEKPAPKMAKSEKPQAKENVKEAPKSSKSANTDISGLMNKIKKMPVQAIRSLSYIVNSMQVQ